MTKQTVAEGMEPLIHAALGTDLPIGVRGWDGSTLGSQDSALTVMIRHRRALRRLVWAPNELGFARAYVSGDIEFAGDLFAGLDALEQVADPARGPGVTIDNATKAAILRAALRLKIIGPPPKPPGEEAPYRGPRHSKDRDADAIAHHYDVGNDFYRMVLGENMTYSCAYWSQPASAQFGLDEAQFAKCDLVARK